MKLFFALLLVVTGFAFSAQAESTVAQCGTPDTYVVETDPDFVYCDIHSRRFAYKEKAQELNKQLVERQKNFIAPRSEAIKAYDAEVDKQFKKPGPGNP